MAELPWLYPRLQLEVFLAEEPPRDEWPNPDEFGRLAREDVRGAEVVLRRAASALAGELGQEGGEHFLRYRQYLRALAGTGPSAGSLELMHGQCSSPALQLEDASVYVSHTIAALEGETEGPGPQLRLVRLFLSLLRDMLPHQPGLLLTCPEIETFCLQQTALAEGVALFQQLKLLQSIYL
ncbi:hypothetical protein QBZ16_001783 [Prototheca wickerhamii]|uniref:Uncharacterized protein n=1 Tax=Prototheca wickerhamii TaxID=3111 RepID=A0AAD9MIV2_PROWI|nr:hypothetical protein QBZ16_001783 [Prototheca wickerhamii]